MNDIIKKIKNTKPRQIVDAILMFLQKYNLTILIILAGILIGFSLVSVSKLTNNISSQASNSGTEDTPKDPDEKLIKFKEATLTKFEALKEDSDVNISSKIASYRRSAFSDITDESSWVIKAAGLLRDFKDKTGSYPSESGIIAALRSQDTTFNLTDSNDRNINQENGLYSYSADLCGSEEDEDDDKGENECDGFLLSANLGASIYQLGETDITKRDWINETGQALDLFYDFEDKNSYPLEDDFINEMSSFYKKVFEKDFIPKGPNGITVNKPNSNYAYKGINCDTSSCKSYVLRTVFKDDASYFRQNK